MRRPVVPALAKPRSLTCPEFPRSKLGWRPILRSRLLPFLPLLAAKFSFSGKILPPAGFDCPLACGFAATLGLIY